jgi:hypothetical protein
MRKDYDEFYNSIGLTDDEDKRIVFDFMDTLFDITLNIMNNIKTDTK